MSKDGVTRTVRGPASETGSALTAPTAEPSPRDVPAATKFKNPFRVRNKLVRFLAYLTLAVICLVWLIPIIGTLVTSVRSAGAAVESGWWHVFSDAGIGLQPYSETWSQQNVGTGLINSALISLPSSIFVMALSAVAAFAFATMRFRGKEVIFVLFCLMLLTPHQIALEPMLALFHHIGLNGSFASVWAFQTGFELPLGILVLRTIFASLPHSLFEAAEIDGASPPKIFTTIALPLSVPGLVSVFVLQFVSSWNDLLDPLVFLGGPKDPITVTVAGLASAQALNTNDVAAIVVLAVIPPILMFVFLQRYFVSGLTAGAIRG
jgi:alpha-glucoside transport system permease protein